MISVSQRARSSVFVLYICFHNIHIGNYIIYICHKIRARHKFSYDFHAILTDLIYTRILSFFSKLHSYSYCRSLLEPPKYTLRNLYRALSVMTEESGFIQNELSRNSNFIHQRNCRTCTMTIQTTTLKLKRECG